MLKVTARTKLSTRTGRSSPSKPHCRPVSQAAPATKERLTAHVRTCVACVNALAVDDLSAFDVGRMCNAGRDRLRGCRPRIHDVSSELKGAAMGLVAMIAKAYRLTPDVVLGSSREPVVSAARHHCYWNLRRIGLSDAASGRIFKRHRKTIADGLHSFEARLERDAALRQWLGIAEAAPEAQTEAVSA